MSSLNRLDYVKALVNSTIYMIGANDMVVIIAFNETIIASNTSFIEATSVNKDYLYSFVNGLTPGGTTNYESAFQAAFDFFN